MYDVNTWEIWVKDTWKYFLLVLQYFVSLKLFQNEKAFEI